MDSGKKKVFGDIVCIVSGFCLILIVVMKARIVISMEGDNCAQTYALFAAMAKTMHTEGFSAWNPYLWGGFPNVGNFITQSCYPVNWILCHLFYDAETMRVSYAIIPCNLILHMGIYFMGMYFLLKRMGFSRLNAFSVGVTSALCGSLLSFMYWLIYLDGFCWLPFLLLAAIGMFETQDNRKLCYSLVLGLLFAIEASISVSLMLIISVFLFGILFLVYLFGDGREHIVGNIQYSILSGIIGILLSAPALLSALTFMGYMARYVEGMGFLEWGSKLPVEEYFRYIYGFPQFLQMITLKSEADLMVSLSPLTVLFCVVGVFSRRKRSGKLFYISLFGMVICGLACFGMVVPAIFYYIPGLNQLREAVMYGILLGLFGGIMAAEGFCFVEGIIRDRNVPRVRRGRFLLLMMAMAGLLGYNIMRGSRLALIFIALAAINGLMACARSAKTRQLVFTACAVGFVGLCAADLYHAADTHLYTEGEAIERAESACVNIERLVDYTDQLEPEDSYYRMTSWGYLPVYPENIASLTGFYDVKGYLNPLLASAINIHTILPLEKRAQLQNIKYYLVNAADEEAILDYFGKSGHYVKAGEIEGIFSDWAGLNEGDVYVYKALDNLGDAWIVSDYIWNDGLNQKEILQRISQETFQVDRTAIMERCELEEFEIRDLETEKSAERNDSTVEGRLSGNKIQYHVEAETSGILVTAEMVYPGWKVYVNGEKRTALTVDGTNRGVIVPAGESVVEFRYEPWEICLGMVLQLLAIALICVLLYHRIHRIWGRGTK